MKRKVGIFLMVFALFLGIKGEVYAKTVYLSDKVRLEQDGNEVFIRTESPLYDGGFTWRPIYKIKNVSKVLKPIEGRSTFSSGVYVDRLPVLEVEGPLVVESLEDDIYLEGKIYENQGGIYKETRNKLYMDGLSRYTIYSESENKQEDIKIKTGEESTKKEEFTRDKISYYHKGYDSGGRLVFEDKVQEIDGREKKYESFLIGGYNWRSQKDLPVVLVNFKRPKKQEINKSFKDVSKNSWYYNYVIKLVEIGGVNGFNDGTFKPNDQIKLGEFLKLSMTSITGKEYPRGSKVHWAEPVYEDALKEGVIKDGDFKRDKKTLDSYISREDMAYIISNIDEKINGNETEIKESSSYKIKDLTSISPKKINGVLKAYHNGLIKGKDGKFAPKDLTTRAEATTVIIRLLERQF